MDFLMLLLPSWVLKAVVCLLYIEIALSATSDFIFVTGKSTLLNNLFHTNFREMDAYRGRHASIFLASFLLLIYLHICWLSALTFYRSQTTKGIWMAHCAGIEPCTIVMDLEGTDGRERGEVIMNFYFSFLFLFSCFYLLTLCYFFRMILHLKNRVHFLHLLFQI